MATKLHINDLLPAGMAPDDVYVMMAAAAAFMVVWAIGDSVVQRDKLQPKLKLIQERREQLKREYIASPKRKKHDAPPDWMKMTVDRFKLLKDGQVSKLNRVLIQAGYRSKDAVVVYAFSKLVLPFVGLALGVLLADITWSDPFATDDLWKWMVVLLTGYAGARLPDVLLHNQRQKRYAAVRKALSDTLDLMMICAEAGLSLAASLDRVSRELGQAYPEMAEELSMTSVELGFLPERNIALKHLAERVDIQEVRGIVNVLLQTEKYGTPIGKALRVLSKEFRTERMLRAEQKAARLPALMTVPMIVFILPTLFVVVMTPAVLGIMDNL